MLKCRGQTTPCKIIDQRIRLSQMLGKRAMPNEMHKRRKFNPTITIFPSAKIELGQLIIVPVGQSGEPPQTTESSPSGTKSTLFRDQKGPKSSPRRTFPPGVARECSKRGANGGQKSRHGAIWGAFWAHINLFTGIMKHPIVNFRVVHQNRTLARGNLRPK